MWSRKRTKPRQERPKIQLNNGLGVDDPFAGSQRLREPLSRRLDGVHLDPLRRQRHCHTGQHPTPAGRHDHGIKIIDLLGHLEPERALPRNHVRVVVRRDHGHPAALGLGRARVVPGLLRRLAKHNLAGRVCVLQW